MKKNPAAGQTTSGSSISLGYNLIIVRATSSALLNLTHKAEKYLKAPKERSGLSPFNFNQRLLSQRSMSRTSGEYFWAEQQRTDHRTPVIVNHQACRSHIIASEVYLSPKDATVWYG